MSVQHTVHHRSGRRSRPSAARRALTAVGCLALSLAVVSCSSGADSAAPVTVTSTVGAPGSAASPSASGALGSAAPGSSPAAQPTASQSGAAGSSPAGAASTPPSASSTRSTSSAASKPPATPSSPATSTAHVAGGAAAYANAKDGVTLPDGFTPHKLKPGEKPPQFVVVSFDGVGWHEKWQYWFGIAKKVPFRFTGFLSGTYLLSDQTKDHYDGPRHKPGASDINWNSASDLPVEIADLNQALAGGNEIGTHFNGHFCGPDGGNDWSTADWNAELDQFFSLLKNYKSNNGISAQLDLTAADIMGERTPCLEGHAEDLFPALVKHSMSYDSSYTKRGISWPKLSPTNKIWQMGMAEFPIHGTLPEGSPVDPANRQHHFQVTMDYNFWVSQRGGKVGSLEESKADSAQVLATYQDMYNAAFNGNRAPLILGNHFNAWNNNAYSDAIGNFVLQTCGRPQTQCVPFQDVVAWMHVQDPARLAQLQAQNPELGG